MPSAFRHSMSRDDADSIAQFSRCFSACRPRCRCPCSNDVRRHRGRGRCDPRRLRVARRVRGRHRAAPAVPWHHRQRAGAGVRPHHCQLEAAGCSAAAAQGQAPQEVDGRQAAHCQHLSAARAYHEPARLRFLDGIVCISAADRAMARPLRSGAAERHSAGNAVPP